MINPTATHDLFSEIDATDLALVMGAAPARILPDAAWYISQRGFGSVFARLAAAGGGLPVINGKPTYGGFPIRVSQQLPQVTSTLNAVPMLLFGSLRASTMLGERREVRIARSALGPSAFENDRVLLRVTDRFDANNHDLAARLPSARFLD